MSAIIYHDSYVYTVKPLNKRSIGDNIYSVVVSFVERLASLGRFKMFLNYRYKEANYLGP